MMLLKVCLLKSELKALNDKCASFDPRLAGSESHINVTFGWVLSEGMPALSGVLQGWTTLDINDFGLNLPTDFLLFVDDTKVYT
ncbi:hypothetical protein J6590_106079 [Homalodisca vitripennis]|nr:hypothetical protein J6590_106079 [Homalodisca vitripennis]